MTEVGEAIWIRSKETLEPEYCRIGKTYGYKDLECSSKHVNHSYPNPQCLKMLRRGCSTTPRFPRNEQVDRVYDDRSQCDRV